MVSKENFAAQGGLSAEQRARISEKYRAAKALLARKRPRESDHQNVKLIDSKGIFNLASGDVNRRVPLSYISVNTLNTGSVKNFKLSNSECPINSCLKDSYSSGINDNIREEEIAVPTKQRTVSDSSKTPIRTLGCMSVNKTESSEGNLTNLIPKDMVVLADNGEVFNSFETPIRRPGCTGSLCSRDIIVHNVELSNRVQVNMSGIEMHLSGENGKTLDHLKTPIRPLEHSCSSTSMDGARIRIGSDEGSVEWKGCYPMGTDSGMNDFKTPVRQQKSFMSEFGVSDEDFDESILQEIDALCENKPKVVAGRESMTYSLQIESQSAENNEGKCSSKADSIVSESGKMLQTEEHMASSDVQGCMEERSKTSEASQIGSMPDAYANYMLSLNDRQREAACSDITIPLMIVAGPGSGKTSTMVGRVLMLLNEGIGPAHILAMTFTTAAASEMRDRIGAVTGKAVAKELMISTFHSFSLQLCRTHAEKMERTPEFLIFGQGQQRNAIIEAVRLLENEKIGEENELCKLGEHSNEINSPKYFKDKSKKWLKFVTQAKASGKNPEVYQKMGNKIGAAVLQNYGKILKSCNALDYHDLISCSVKLLTDFPEVMKECQETWKAIVIDEFQDTSVMQYGLLRILASHDCITIVGDEDQSIFSFNGADSFGFNSFRKDFPTHKEVRLNKNYRSTRCIIEAASCLIRNNAKRFQSKDVLTDNSSGSKITIKECCSEDAQCAFVVDKILEMTSNGSSVNSSFGNVSVLYRRQVSGRMFQTAFRDREIPFNIHGVAFYRKKVVRVISSMLSTTLPGCDDGSYRRVFKALLPFEKEEKKKVIEHIDKISTIRKCSFISAAHDIFSAKISGTFKRSQLTQGRKVLVTLDMISKLVHGEQSISAVITSVANMIPQKYLLEQRAVLDVDGGKLLNEDNDLRSVLQYLLDDVSDFLKAQNVSTEAKRDNTAEEKGCINILKGFIDYISERERENFHCRRHDNEHSVTLTTIHQSKGLEWDTVFIVKTNESEIPLLHEYNGVANETASSLEEERRLLYVAMTRARKKLFILYVLMDSNWQVLQPSRFLREIPKYLQEVQDEQNSSSFESNQVGFQNEILNMNNKMPNKTKLTEVSRVVGESTTVLDDETSGDSMELIQACNGNNFLKRFSTEERTVVSHLFHHWAKKAAFQEPKRLLDKVGFVIDERLRIRKGTHKDVLRELKSCLRTDEAFQYAEYVLKWEQIPADKRAYIMREKQEHFQKLRIENAMGSSAPTSKQIGYLRNLGCTVDPTSRLHASRLIEQYKSL